MSTILQPLQWFYHEFGVVSIHKTGRNAYLMILARTCRMFAYGANALILAIFFSALNYSDRQIGIFMTLTMLGDVFLGTFLTLVADRIGRRKVMLGGSVLMVFSGVIFATMENFWILLLAAVLGVISVTGGDFGPFRSIEESVISHLTTSDTRADVLAWYVTISTLGSGIGSEASGRIVNALQNRDGWTTVDAYHALFWIYAAMGVVNGVLVLLLTEACEISPDQNYSQIPQHENDDPTDASQDRAEVEVKIQSPRSLVARVRIWLTGNLTQISADSRSIMYKLWFLLSVDCLADGMVPYSLTNYYMDIKFHPAKSTLGDITSVSYFLGAIGSSFAGPLARKIGLINTMVFTHVPSSAAVLFFPLPPYFWMTALLLLIRTGFNPMDQAPRSAFIAAVVKPEERTAIMGITSMLRTLASMSGPLLTGSLAANQKFWIAFVVAGVCRLAYDFGLWAMFVNMNLHAHERRPEDLQNSGTAHGVYDEEESLEMSSLAESDSSSDKPSRPKEEIDATTATSNLQPPAQQGKVRSRSPHGRSRSEL